MFAWEDSQVAIQSQDVSNCMWCTIHVLEFFFGFLVPLAFCQIQRPLATTTTTFKTYELYKSN